MKQKANICLRILIVEDSAIFATVLKDTLEAEPDIEVVAVATNGLEAVECCAQLRPDLVLMDIHMPHLDGLSATERIMAQCPTPILVITADPERGGVNLSFRALSAGALELTTKPSALPFPDDEREALLRKVRLLAHVPVVRHVRGNRKLKGTPISGPHTSLTPRQQARRSKRAEQPLCIIGIVASTGGPRALARLFADLPPDLPAALIVVQHITQGFSTHLASWLDTHSKLRVMEAQTGVLVEAGHAYIAPTEVHIELGPHGRLLLKDGPPVHGHRPSGDLLLTSLARRAPRVSVGVILSGMGDDGSVGMSALHEAGSLTLVQDPESSVVYSMPRSALERDVVTEVVNVDKLAARLVEQARLLVERSG